MAVVRAAHRRCARVGVLGWLNIRIDPWVQAAWAAAWLVAVAMLFLRAGGRARLLAGLLVLIDVTANVLLLDALRTTGFTAQARFTIALPIATVVVLVVGQPQTAGAARRSGPLRHWPLGVASVVAAAGHLSGLLVTAQHNAIGLGAPIRLRDAAWAPPGGLGADADRLRRVVRLVARARSAGAAPTA